MRESLATFTNWLGQAELKNREFEAFDSSAINVKSRVSIVSLERW